MRIGLTMYETSFPTDTPDIHSVRLGEYPLTDVLIMNHVIPLLLPTVYPSHKVIQHLINQMDGLILGGGDDITPSIYGAAPIEPELNYPLRDKFEIAILRTAINKKIPVLGICRGCQMINVARGGTLYQNIYQQINGHNLINHEDSQHPVYINKHSYLYQIMGAKQIVNSRHHQAIHKLGHNLNVVARAPDGIIEGIESSNALLQGVQWHPENLWKRNPFQKHLFRAFFQRVKKADQNKKE